MLYDNYLLWGMSTMEYDGERKIVVKLLHDGSPSDFTCYILNKFVSKKVVFEICLQPLVLVVSL